MNKYKLKRTSFSEFNEPLTELPTIMTSIVYKDNRTWIYGQDFSIAFGMGAVQNLTQGRNNPFGSPDVFLENIFARAYHEGNTQNTFRIKPLNHHMRENSPTIRLLWTLNSSPDILSKVASISAKLTAENNSIPCINSNFQCHQMFFDGDTKDLVIRPSQMGYTNVYPVKYTYLPEFGVKCRNKPFNEETLRQLTEKIREECQNPCRPNTTFGINLDTIVQDLPLCSSDIDLQCFDMTVVAVQKNISRKPCTKLEYKIDGTVYPFLFPSNQAQFMMKFSTPVISVKEEYLIYDLVAVISAVGGTMGLCIGFSFHDTTKILLEYVERGLNWANLRRLQLTKRENIRNIPKQNVNRLLAWENSVERRLAALERCITQKVTVKQN